MDTLIGEVFDEVSFDEFEEVRLYQTLSLHSTSFLYQSSSAQGGLQVALVEASLPPP
jgi:hypothetical protein